jgi:hypothetical protein
VNTGRLKTPYAHGLSSKVVIFYPICRCQRTSDGTMPAGSAGSWDPTQPKLVRMDRPTALGAVTLKFVNKKFLT